MKILDVNRLLATQQFQSAAINYLSCAFREHSFRKFFLILERHAKRKLDFQLRERALDMTSATTFNGVFSKDEWISVPKDSYINLFSVVKESLKLVELTDPSDVLGWCRLDFVVSGGINKQKGKLALQLFSIYDSPTLVCIPFVFNTFQSIIFPTSAKMFFQKSFEKTLDIQGYGFSFTIISLEENQIVEHLLENFLAHSNNKKYDENFFFKDNSKKFIQEILDFHHLYVKDNFFKSEEIESLIVYKSITKAIDDVLTNYYNQFDIDLKKNLTSFTSDNIADSFGALGFGIELYFDVLYRLGSTYILYGWISDPLEQVCSIRFVDLAGRVEFELLCEFVHFERLDVIQYLSKLGRYHDAQHGFACAVICVDRPFTANDLFRQIETVTLSGKKFITSVPVTTLPNDLRGVTEAMRLVPNTAISRDFCEKLYQRLFLTQIKPFQKIEQNFNKKYFGSVGTESPRLSVIIPLFGSVRFELTQIPIIASLRKPDWELIFAVDDPSILNDVKANVRRLAEYYGVTATVIAPTHNLGFAGINNFAVERSEANLLLFLNSDCFITKSEAITKAIDRLNHDPVMGAVGFRLLYADNTIQHDGMSVEKWDAQEDFFINAHPRQGMPNKLIPQHIISDSSCLLTAACLLIPRSIFESVGGFDQRFFMGDFEDSDICLKILNVGKKLGIVRADGIFHLERQSIKQVDSVLRQRVTMTNSNIYSNKWKGMLEGGSMAPLTVI